MNRIFAITLTLLFIFVSPLAAQTEAEGITETLIFQEKEGQKTVEIKKGDQIRILENEDDKQTNLRGKIISIKENSIEVFNKNTGKKYIVDLTQVAGISNSRSESNGTGLIIAGATLSVLFIILSFLAAYSTIFLGGFLALFAFVFFLMGLGFLIAGLVKRARRGFIIWLKSWTWRLVRKKRVIVKKKKL